MKMMFVIRNYGVAARFNIGVDLSVTLQPDQIAKTTDEDLAMYLRDLGLVVQKRKALPGEEATLMPIRALPEPAVVKLTVEPLASTEKGMEDEDAEEVEKVETGDSVSEDGAGDDGVGAEPDPETEEDTEA